MSQGIAARPIALPPPFEPLPQRWPPERSLAKDLGAWSVAYVKPRHEKALALDLMASGHSYYLPMIWKRHPRPDNGKLKRSLVPLFPSYVSVAGVQDTLALFQTYHVVKIVRVEDQERFVREVEAVQRLLACGSALNIHPGLVLGASVRIIRGPLVGLTGTVQRIGETYRLWISVEMFCQSVAVEIGADTLMPVA